MAALKSDAGPKNFRSSSLRLFQRGATGLVLFALILPLVFTALLSMADNRSYVIEARSSFLKVRFVAQQPDWRLADALVCTPLAIPRRDATDQCGAAAEPKAQRGEVLPQWAEGDTISVSVKPNGGLRITALNDTRELSQGGFILVSPEGWTQSGALLLRGHVTLGQPLASGATRNYLWSGTWEARETGQPTFLFGTSTNAVQNGTLFAGTEVRIFREDDETGEIVDALSYGHIARRSKMPVMDISLVSEFADARLSVKYDGVPDPVVSKPSWVDIALNSPLLIAIASIFPILTSLGLVLSDLLGRFGSANTPSGSAKRSSNNWQTRKILRELRRRR